MVFLRGVLDAVFCKMMNFTANNFLVIVFGNGIRYTRNTVRYFDLSEFARHIVLVCFLVSAVRCGVWVSGILVPKRMHDTLVDTVWIVSPDDSSGTDNPFHRLASSTFEARVSHHTTQISSIINRCLWRRCLYVTARV